MKYKAVIEYDGTEFYGWQVQTDLRTVQGVLLDVCRQVFGTPLVEVYAAGRTDSGVHASGQVIHIAVNSSLTAEQAGIAINNLLPEDINILEMDIAPDSFHARHDAVARTYLYSIAKKDMKDARKYAWFVPIKLKISAIKNAASLFEGMHDYRSFGENEKKDQSTKVEIQTVEVVDTPEFIEIRITGSHFLWKQVRRMIGVLVEVGKGKLTDADVERYLKTFSNEPPKFTAPPHGLYLEDVYYEIEN